MCASARASRRRYVVVGLTNSVKPLAARIKTLSRSNSCLWLSLACLAALPSQVQAQEAPDRQEAPGRFVLEAGIGGGSSVCPGHYVGINGRVAGPVSWYGMVWNYRCADRAGSANQIGASVLLGRASWLVRPVLRAGIQYGSGDYVEPTAGASLTFGRRYGARFILHIEECGSTACERFQMGGYVSF